MKPTLFGLINKRSDTLHIRNEERLKLSMCVYMNDLISVSMKEWVMYCKKNNIPITYPLYTKKTLDGFLSYLTQLRTINYEFSPYPSSPIMKKQ